MKKEFFIICCLLMSHQSVSQGILFEIPNLETVMKKATKEGKMIFLYANVYDCLPCDDLERYAFQDTEVGDFYNQNFISVSFDMETFPGVELAERYQLFVYPGLLFLNPKGDVIHRTCGAMDHDQLLSEARIALDDTKNLKSYQTKFYKGNREYDFLREYGALIDNACLESRVFIDFYFNNTDRERWTDSTSWMMIRDFVFEPLSEPFQYLTAYHENFVELYGKKVVDEKIYSVLLSQFVSIYEGQDLTLFATQSLSRLIDSLNFEGKNELKSMIQMMFAEQIENWPLYAQNVIFLYDNYEITDSYQLNEFAWKFYLFVEETAYLDKARNWMKKVSKESPTPTNLDTYASLLYKTGDYKNAIKKSQEALALAISKEEDVAHYQVQLQKFKTQ